MERERKKQCWHFSVVFLLLPFIIRVDNCPTGNLIHALNCSRVLVHWFFSFLSCRFHHEQRICPIIVPLNIPWRNKSFLEQLIFMLKANVMGHLASAYCCDIAKNEHGWYLMHFDILKLLAYVEWAIRRKRNKSTRKICNHEKLVDVEIQVWISIVGGCALLFSFGSFYILNGMRGYSLFPASGMFFYCFFFCHLKFAILLLFI